MKFFKGIFVVAYILVACVLFAEGTPWTGNATLTGKLIVESNVADAEVYFDSELLGTVPLDKDGLAPGIHQIAVMKDGYIREIRTIRIIAGEETSIRIELRPIIGMLDVTGIPEHTTFVIIVGGKSHYKQSIEVSEGTFPVTIRVFGYKDTVETISVTRDKTIKLKSAAEKEPFSASGLEPAKKSFNPQNPAKLGTMRFSFLVTAPGTGTLEIRDAEGTIVRTITAAPFTTWKQVLVWDGHDENRKLLPDGTYSVTLRAEAEDGGEKTSLDTTVRIDRTQAYPMTESSAGVGSMGPVVSAALLPPKGMTFGFDGYGQSNEFGSGASFQAGFTDFLEGGAHLSAGIGNNSDTAIDFAGGIKAGRKAGNLDEAIALVWRTRSGTISDSSAPYRNGLALGPALEYRLGAITAGVFPAIIVGNDSGFFSGAYCTGSAGASLRFALGIFSGGVWGNVDSGKTGGAFNTLSGWGTGAMLQFTIPATNLFITCDTAWTEKESEDGVLTVKGGFGVRF